MHWEVNTTKQRTRRPRKNWIDTIRQDLKERKHKRDVLAEMNDVDVQCESKSTPPPKTFCDIFTCGKPV